MYIYELGYYSPEGSYYHQLMHPSEFSREQLLALVCEATRQVLLELLEGSHQQEIGNLRIEGLLEFVGNALIHRFGFKPLELRAQLHFYRWAELFDPTDQGGEHQNPQSDFLRLENALEAELSPEQIEQLRNLFRIG
ncbi:MAG: hypothetical protein HYY20_11525 [Candidatus Tectomicrobia bacterium]|uniref:Uncharacterized protein n=1 Tax=Tectimicrobiota bacterium TaxID=2528274 RepID=A0A932CQC0_UNCTE|nr:hypothetical protein [Candidatus Tectomicrobia bacterium]